MDFGQEKGIRGEDEEVCPDCKGTGIVKEKNGQAHTCWKCLREGRLDVHSKKLPDTKIKL